MFSDEKMELHVIIKKLRLERGYTQKEVAEYLGIDVSTYAHYEAARRTPNIEKLRKLANLYDLKDELLGATFPIVVRTVYPKKMVGRLERAINECPNPTGSYQLDKVAYNNLKQALDPILEIKYNALDLPEIDLKEHTECLGKTIKLVELDRRVEKLIQACLDKQDKLWNL